MNAIPVLNLWAPAWATVRGRTRLDELREGCHIWRPTPGFSHKGSLSRPSSGATVSSLSGGAERARYPAGQHSALEVFSRASGDIWPDPCESGPPGAIGPPVTEYSSTSVISTNSPERYRGRVRRLIRTESPTRKRASAAAVHAWRCQVFVLLTARDHREQLNIRAVSSCQSGP